MTYNKVQCYHFVVFTITLGLIQPSLLINYKTNQIIYTHIHMHLKNKLILKKIFIKTSHGRVKGIE